jgi:putative redox protein
MIATTTWLNEMVFQGRSESGHAITFDASKTHAEGASPMEAVLVALCGCTSADIVAILKGKGQPLSGLTVSAEAEQAGEPPRVFTKIKLVYRISGPVSREAAEDAVAKSKNKFCSVSKMLEKTASIEFVVEYAEGSSPDPAV